MSPIFLHKNEAQLTRPFLAGDEAELVATATSVPKIVDAVPLLNPSTLDNQSSSDVLRYLGNLAPMFSVESFGLPDANELVPEGCELTQVHLVHRHGRIRVPWNLHLPLNRDFKVLDILPLRTFPLPSLRNYTTR